MNEKKSTLCVGQFFTSICVGTNKWSLSSGSDFNRFLRSPSSPHAVRQHRKLMIDAKFCPRFKITRCSSASEGKFLGQAASKNKEFHCLNYVFSLSLPMLQIILQNYYNDEHQFRVSLPFHSFIHSRCLEKAPEEREGGMGRRNKRSN